MFFESSRISYFTSNKDRIPILSNSFVIYVYECPGCADKYIGKTETTLFNRTDQHGWTQKDSAVFKHFQKCEGWSHLRGILECHGEPVDQRSLQIQTVRENTKIIGRSSNWHTVAFKESLAIKGRQPALNNGMKKAKELCFF